MAARVEADDGRRPRLRPQVGHGVDARHARSTSRTTRSTARTTTNELTFRSMYAFTENFVLPLFTRRGRLRQGVAPREDAGGRVAEAREPAPPPFVYVGAAGEEAALHGGRVRRSGASGTTTRASTGTCSGSRRTATWRGSSGRSITCTAPSQRSTRRDAESSGFEWIDGSNAAQSVLTFLRRGGEGTGATTATSILVCLNFTPEPREHYRVGVPRSGSWREALNSDAIDFGGSGHGNFGRVATAPIAWNGRRHSISITIPPLGAVFFKPEP